MVEKDRKKQMSDVKEDERKNECGEVEVEAPSELKFDLVQFFKLYLFIGLVIY